MPTTHIESPQRLDPVATRLLSRLKEVNFGNSQKFEEFIRDHYKDPFQPFVTYGKNLDRLSEAIVRAIKNPGITAEVGFISGKAKNFSKDLVSLIQLEFALHVACVEKTSGLCVQIQKTVS